jgi:heavy metal translocating P-type ATPase
MRHAHWRTGSPSLPTARHAYPDVVISVPQRLHWLREPEVLIALAALLGVLAGLVLAATNRHTAANVAWAVVTGALLIPLTWSVIRTLLRRDVGVDAIALVAMAGALALQEFLAGAVVALMLAGGNALEAAAGRRARHDLEALVARAPTWAMRRTTSGDLERVPAEDVLPGEILLVRSGEIVPVDGRIEDVPALLDESALTGEPMPVERMPGDAVRSGVANAAEAFQLVATRPAAESAYAAIVRLVAAAESRRAPFERMADRYAALLLPVTLVAAGIAWAMSGDPVRALAVLVVATPCPLILAAPIALVSGVSRAARRGVVLKGGVVVEQLARTTAVLLDKTGTLTVGQPAIQRVATQGGARPDDVLRLAASLEQHSAHVVAGALVSAAHRDGLALTLPVDVQQEHGRGIEGTIAGHRVSVGSADWLRSCGIDPTSLLDARRDDDGDGQGVVLVGIDGAPSGLIVLADPVRPDAARMIARLHESGVTEVAMVTGDRRDIAEAVAARLGIDVVHADCTPEDKVAVVTAMRAGESHHRVAMVGDGINDAPALAMADVGVAMSAPGATIASETADAVVMVDRLDGVADAIVTSRRASAIARQSVVAGMLMSFVAMGFAALGYLPPVAGALLQEGIDVIVILNALRALRA